jgi:integrase
MVEDFKVSRIRETRSVRTAHDNAVDRAGISEHFHLYDLRHTFASRAAAAGVELSTLAGILGHTKIQMTMRYVHPSGEQNDSRQGNSRRFD